MDYKRTKRMEEVLKKIEGGGTMIYENPSVVELLENPQGLPISPGLVKFIIEKAEDAVKKGKSFSEFSSELTREAIAKGFKVNPPKVLYKSRRRGIVRPPSVLSPKTIKKILRDAGREDLLIGLMDIKNLRGIWKKMWERGRVDREAGIIKNLLAYKPDDVEKWIKAFEGARSADEKKTALYNIMKLAGEALKASPALAEWQKTRDALKKTKTAEKYFETYSGYLTAHPTAREKLSRRLSAFAPGSAFMRLYGRSKALAGVAEEVGSIEDYLGIEETTGEPVLYGVEAGIMDTVKNVFGEQITSLPGAIAGIYLGDIIDGILNMVFGGKDKAPQYAPYLKAGAKAVFIFGSPYLEDFVSRFLRMDLSNFFAGLRTGIGLNLISRLTGNTVIKTQSGTMLPSFGLTFDVAGEIEQKISDLTIEDLDRLEKEISDVVEKKDVIDIEADIEVDEEIKEKLEKGEEVEIEAVLDEQEVGAVFEEETSNYEEVETGMGVEGIFEEEETI